MEVPRWLRRSLAARHSYACPPVAPMSATRSRTLPAPTSVSVSAPTRRSAAWPSGVDFSLQTRQSHFASAAPMPVSGTSGTGTSAGCEWSMGASSVLGCVWGSSIAEGELGGRVGYSPKQHRCCWASQTMNGHLPDAQRFVRFGSVVHSDVLIAPASLNGVRTAACPASHARPASLSSTAFRGSRGLPAQRPLGFTLV